MRPRRRGPSASILIPVAVLCFAATARAIQNDFSSYPVNSQTCLYSAANKSGCQGDTLQEMNGCLCSNTGDFVTGSASCIGGTDPGDLSSVYSIMSNACSFSNTPLGFSESQFLAAGSSSAAATTASPTKTSTQQKTASSAAKTTSSPSASVSVVISTVSGGNTVTVTETSPASTSSNNGSGQGSGDLGNNNSSSPGTGLIAGVAAGGAVALALIAAAIFFLLRHRRRKAASVHDEAHPMLPGAGYGPFGGGDFAMQQGGASEQKWRPPSGQEWNAPPSTSPQPTNFNWETPYQSAWNNSPSPQPPPFQQRPDSMGPSQMQYHQPPPPDQGNYPPPASASQAVQGPGYGAHQQNVFELQGPETPMPGQAPAEVPSSPVRPLRGGHNYPPPTWH